MQPQGIFAIITMIIFTIVFIGLIISSLKKLFEKKEDERIEKEKMLLKDQILDYFNKNKGIIKTSEIIKNVFDNDIEGEQVNYILKEMEEELKITHLYIEGENLYTRRWKLNR